MTRKWFNLTLVLVMLTTLLLSACSKSTPTPEPTTAPTEAATTAAPTEAASGGSDWARIQAAGKLIVGTSADYPPFEFVNDKNEFDGFDMALIREIGKRLGLEIEIQDISFNGLIAALKAGQIDVIVAAMSATPERDKEVDFTDNYYIGTDAILVREDSDITLNTAEDMAKYKIGVQTGTVHETWVQENLVDSGKMSADNVSHYDRAELAIADLKNGRVDVVAMDYYAAQAYIKQGGIKLALKQNLSGENLAIAVPEGASELQAKLNEVIQQLWDEGFVDKLAQQYLGGDAGQIGDTDEDQGQIAEITGPNWERIQAAGKLIVGTSADYPPFEFVNDKNEFDGFDMALIREIGKRLGLEIEIQDISFNGLIAALKAGQIDVIVAAMSATPERDKEVDFTDNYYIGTDAILVREDSDITLNTAEDMAKYKIGVQTGTVHETWVQENLVDSGKMSADNVSHYDRAELAIADLKNGRVDVVAMDYYAAQAYIKQGGIKLALKQNLSGENLAIAVPEGAKGLQWHLNQVIQQLWDEGYIEKLAQQYLTGNAE